MFVENATTCDCVIGFYYKSGQCIPCHPFCATCFGGTIYTCGACRSIAGVAPYPISNACICLPYYNYIERIKKCTPCFPLCLDCNSTTLKCLSCISFTGVSTIVINDTCSCLDGYFYDQHATMCFQCSDLLCKACDSSGDGKVCDQCKTSSGAIMVGDKCECRNGYFYDANNLECSPCSAGCVNCTNNKCLACINSSYLIISGRCQLNCTYIDKLGKEACISCSGIPNCLFCLESKCFQCEGQYLLSISGCVLECPNSTHKSTQNGINLCKVCDSACKSCYGPSNSKCIQCAGGYEKNEIEICVAAPCKPDEYSFNSVCQKCHIKCAACSGPSELNCIACNLGYVQVVQNDSVRCLLCGEIKMGTYLNTYTGACDGTLLIRDLRRWDQCRRQ